MDSIFALAAEEGITALDLSADSLREWIVDIIDKNNIKLVLIWDEFSDYFRQNSTSLGEFQKIVSICQEKPFYFVIVTHPLSSLAKKYDSGDKTNPWSVVQQRFDKVEITLPDNIAFNLIHHAFSVKSAAKANWEQMTGDLNADVPNARNAVIKVANISDENVMRDILPIHPIAALVLKNIASAFQSNQRSMFDFIKTPKDMDTKAFQRFIQNTSPLSDRPFLTVDMLWDFFYEKGKDYLSSDIRLILDAFSQQTQLNEKEFLQKADFFDDIDSADYRDKCFAECVIGDYTSLISDIDAVRDALEGTGISAYEWNDNPSIRNKISSMATAEYNAGGSDKVVSIIEGMDDAELKKWLTDVVRKDIDLGVKIIINREA